MNKSIVIIGALIVGAILVQPLIPDLAYINKIRNESAVKRSEELHAEVARNKLQRIGAIQAFEAANLLCGQSANPTKLAENNYSEAVLTDAQNMCVAVREVRGEL